MPVDPTIAAGFQAPQIANPLQQFGQFAQTANMLQQNQLMQQETSNLGTVGQQLGVNLTTSQQEQKTANANRITAQLAGLLASPPGTLDGGQAVFNAVDQEVKEGTISPESGAAYKAGLPPLGSPDAAYRPVLAQHLVGTLAGPQAAQAIFGQNADINTGGQQFQGVQASPMMGGAFKPATVSTNTPGPALVNTGPAIVPTSGGAPIGPGIPTGLSPPEKVNLQPIMVGGTPGTIPVGARFTPTGDLPPQSPFANGGHYSPPGAPPAPPPGFTPTALPVGQSQSIEANQQAFRVAQADVPVAQQRIAGLQKAQQALSLISSGPSTAGMHQMYSFLVAQGVAPPGLTDDVANYDLARKYLTDYARNSVTAPDTNQALGAALGSNASTEVSNKAALDVVATNIGRERMNIAQTMTAPDPTGSGFLAHGAQFSSSLDRRGFAADAYSPQELQTMEAGMKPAEQAKFFKSMAVAAKLGLLNLPAQAAPAATATPGG